ncbi:MAG TPA: hypothetical protein PLE19_19060 [Planctomycetota bacterium]|nr:hypothetical protein [Planctomycetota bacterium]HRR80441.1 hypothetical protein [Planctomycetota bacterium]HRT96627.1 hypothetical protein [Planctomycetota bacterium]
MPATLAYNVPTSYRHNGYIYIKGDDRHLFPPPGTTVDLLLGESNVPVQGRVRMETKNRLRVYGLRQWFASLGEKRDLTVEIIPVQPMKTYRIRPTGR